MQPEPENKSIQPRARRTPAAPRPAGGEYSWRCPCKRLVNLPVDGTHVRCAGCGADWHWHPFEGAVLGSRHG